MTKKKIHLEYSLDNVSGTVLWNAISTPEGLEKWMADRVTVNERTYTFEWGKDEVKRAELITRRSNSHIRFHWIDDEEPDSYFELRIENNELTGDYSLLVEDTVDEDEVEDMTDLWNIEVESLLRQCGM